MIKNLISSLFILLLFGCIPEQSKLIIINYYSIDGPINQYEFDKFKIKVKDIDILVLNSKGGLLYASKQMALLIRQYQITTIIPKDGICESACTLLFQSGQKRIIDPTATIMYHGMRFPYMKAYIEECPEYTNECEIRFENMKKYIKEETTEYFYLNEKYGASTDIIDKVKQQNISKTWLEDGNLLGYKDMRINAIEALEYNVATDIVEVYLHASNKN